MIVVGGVIPPQDYDALRKAGAEAIFPPGTVIAEAAEELIGKLNARLGHGGRRPNSLPFHPQAGVIRPALNVVSIRAQNPELFPSDVTASFAGAYSAGVEYAQEGFDDLPRLQRPRHDRPRACECVRFDHDRAAGSPRPISRAPIEYRSKQWSI